jgi:hypothetical protein
MEFKREKTKTSNEEDPKRERQAHYLYKRALLSHKISQKVPKVATIP